MQGPEAQNIAHRHQKYDHAFFFFSIKCNDFSTVLELYFEIHRGGTPRGEDFIYYDSMHKCIIKTIPLVSKNNNVWFFVKILLKMTPALGTGLELGTFAVCKIV